MIKMDFEPALPLISLLARRPARLPPALQRLRKRWPAITLYAPAFLFNETEYYDAEFGRPLFRWWACRPLLTDPSRLISWKKQCAEIETELTDSSGNRTVNIDVGYLNFSLVVLASFKHNRQKIYLGEGIYADPVLRYYAGDFRCFDWTFPDFQKNYYYGRLRKFREIYRNLRNFSTANQV